VVVALDLEADGLAVAQVDHAGVLTGALQHAFTRGGKPLEEESRMLVAAVLRPEEREDRQLEVIRVALEQGDDPGKLRVRQPERPVQRLVLERLFGDPRQVIQCSREARRQSPRSDSAWVR
jgi:hypothetical protein